MIAVIPRLKTSGVNAPGTPHKDFETKVVSPATYDWRFPRNTPPNTAGIFPAAKVMLLKDAMETVWDTEAMGLRYLMRDPQGRTLSKMPRVNKGSIEWIRSEGYDVVLRNVLTDHDTPGHKEWLDEDEVLFQARLANRPPPLEKAIMYKTGRGWRSGLWLDDDVPIEESEMVIRGYMLWCEKHEIAVDWACADWPHVFRMPRTFRPKKNKRDDFDCHIPC